MRRTYSIVYFTPTLSQLYVAARNGNIGPHHYILFKGVSSINVDIGFTVEFVRFKKLYDTYKRYYFSDDGQYIDAVSIKVGLALLYPYASYEKFIDILSMDHCVELTEDDIQNAASAKQFSNERELLDYSIARTKSPSI